MLKLGISSEIRYQEVGLAFFWVLIQPLRNKRSRKGDLPIISGSTILSRKPLHPLRFLKTSVCPWFEIPQIREYAFFESDGLKSVEAPLV